MTRHHKSEAPPADKTEGAMICLLNNDSVNGTSRLTEAETSHALFTPSAS